MWTMTFNSLPNIWNMSVITIYSAVFTYSLQVLVNPASAPWIDTNMELIVNPLPKSALVSCPPTTATFLNLVSELFAFIMTYLPTSDLLHLAQQFNDRLKAESTWAYLIRINILHNHDVVYLTRDVPATLVATIYIMYYMVATTGHLHQLPQMKWNEFSFIDGTCSFQVSANTASFCLENASFLVSFLSLAT